MLATLRVPHRVLFVAIALLLLAAPACRNDAGIVEEHERMLQEEEEPAE